MISKIEEGERISTEPGEFEDVICGQKRYQCQVYEGLDYEYILDIKKENIRVVNVDVTYTISLDKLENGVDFTDLDETDDSGDSDPGAGSISQTSDSDHGASDSEAGKKTREPISKRRKH
jgi:hypothetical protein